MMVNISHQDVLDSSKLQKYYFIILSLQKSALSHILGSIIKAAIIREKG